MWEFLQTAEGIALASVTVAGLSLLVTGLSIWLNYRGSEKRLKHEKEMQTEQLDHERREAVRQTAAEAFVQANELAESLSVEKVLVIGDQSEDGFLPDDLREAFTKSERSLQLVEALGWTKEVRNNATYARLELRTMYRAAFGTVGVIRSSVDDSEALVACGQKQTAAVMALEEYRTAIAE